MPSQNRRADCGRDRPFNERASGLEVLGDPLVGQGAFVAEEIAECVGNLGLDGRSHERDVHGHLVVVDQGGGDIIAGEADGALEINGGALDIGVVVDGCGTVGKCADVDHALDLECLADHGADCLWEDLKWKDLEEGDCCAAVSLVELIDLAWFRGEVLCNIRPVFLSGEGLVDLLSGLVDRYGVFCTRCHEDKTTVSGVLDSSLTQEIAAIDGAELDPDVTFADLTTLHIGGKPRLAVRCASLTAVTETIRKLDGAGVELLVVGGGSNLVVADGDLDLVAVIIEADEVTLHLDTGLVVAEAGAEWDDVVSLSVDAGLGGIECLSGIPGSAGATPVQNVGAYGVEISDVLTRVQLLERATGEVAWVSAGELELAYRYSNLKFTNRAVVLAIELQLRDGGMSAPLRFGELARRLAVSEEENAAGEVRRPIAMVREAVLELRRAKGMVVETTDHDTWSAGSFFTNPIVDSALADVVQAKVAVERGEQEAARMPRYAAGSGSGQEKLSAAWLIERAGFTKGHPGPSAAAGLSTKHTLALTNRGEATSTDLVALAREIRAGVFAAFGVTLVPEPVWIGVSID